jgi:hypothetical protein
MAKQFLATRMGRGAEMLERRRVLCAARSSTARPVEMVLPNKLTYRKLFASLNLDDKCNLISSSGLKARVPRGGTSGAGSPAPCRRDLAAARRVRGAKMLEQRRVPYAACSSDATIGD